MSDKKQQVRECLDLFAKLIETAIDNGADTTLTPIEMIYVTADLYYQRFLAEKLVTTTREAFNPIDGNSCPDKVEPPENEGATVIPFPRVLT